MFKLFGFAVLALFILGIIPLVIRLLAAAAVLLVVLALLAASSLLVFRIVRAFTAPKIKQARQRAKVRERHQEGRDRRQSQERQQKHSRRQEEDRTQDRHQQNSRHRQKKQQWSNGQNEKADTHPRSYYEMLGIESNATREEIDEAWRRIDFGQYLPIEIRRTYFEAYSVLTAPEKRRQYDAKLERQRHEKESKQNQGQRRHQEREHGRQTEYEQKSYQEQDRHRHTGTGQKEKPPLTGTYYELLGIEPKASRDEIAKAWRRFAIQWHPDVCNYPDATEVFQAGNEAREALLDPAKRRLYDAQLRHKQHATGAGWQAQYRSRAENSQQSKHWDSTVRSQQSRQWRAGKNRNYHSHRGSSQSTKNSRSRRSSKYRGRYFKGTWARIRLGPWSGSWGAWIESLYVLEGDYAIIRRQDGREILVVVISVLNRSQGNRVTLCRVKSI